MNLRTYCYRDAADRSGLSIGVSRHLPRGVSRSDYAARGYFHVWLPLVAPSAALVAAYRRRDVTFAQFAAAYRREMTRAAPRQAIRLLAAVAQGQPVNLGCFCADTAACHRTVLADLIREAGTERSPENPARPEFFSPACSMPEIED